MPAIVMKKIATNPQQQQKKWRKRIIARSTIRSDDDVTDFVLQRWTFFSSEWNQIIWYIWYAVTLLVLCIALLTVLDGNRLKITFLFYFITIVKIMRSLRLLCHNWYWSDELGGVEGVAFELHDWQMAMSACWIDVHTQDYRMDIS